MTHIVIDLYIMDAANEKLSVFKLPELFIFVSKMKRVRINKPHSCEKLEADGLLRFNTIIVICYDPHTPLRRAWNKH